MEPKLHPLISYFEDYLPLNQLEEDQLLSFAKERIIKRRQFILQEGDVCQRYTFIIEGCFKMYKVDEKGNEHNLQFAIENEWITDIGSFHSEKTSNLYIEALEQSRIIQIEKPHLLQLFESNNTFNRTFRVLIENAYVDLQQRVLQNISSTAEERYLAFIDQYPHLFNRISNVQIASYLGITPEFLSKIRKDLQQKKN